MEVVEHTPVVGGCISALDADAERSPRDFGMIGERNRTTSCWLSVARLRHGLPTRFSLTKEAIGISALLTDISSWHGASESGKAQIDLVIDRRDRTINICEIKFSVGEFVIDQVGRRDPQ